LSKIDLKISFLLGKLVVGDAAPRIVPKCGGINPKYSGKQYNSRVNLKVHIHSGYDEIQNCDDGDDNLTERFTREFYLADLYWIATEIHVL
jgi:hypothetical protein